MDADAGRKRVRLGLTGTGENEMNFVLFRIEIASENLDNMLGSAAAQMRYQQTNSETLL